MAYPSCYHSKCDWRNYGVVNSMFLNFQRRKKGKNLHTTVTKSSGIPLSITSDSTQRTSSSAATENFDDNFVIGHGGFSNEYKGYIDNGATIVSSNQGVPEFETEIHMLSKLRHLHLISLIGYCDDNNEMILVYDYMAHGTLRDHLYRTDNDPLPWTKRLEICIGA
ncbi:hypothetical protein P3S67_006197 [Capsicum chacoense]